MMKLFGMTLDKLFYIKVLTLSLHKNLREIKDEEELIYQNSPKVIRRVISEETSKKVAELLEYVVAKGTGGVMLY